MRFCYRILVDSVWLRALPIKGVPHSFEALKQAFCALLHPLLHTSERFYGLHSRPSHIGRSAKRAARGYRSDLTRMAKQRAGIVRRSFNAKARCFEGLGTELVPSDVTFRYLAGRFEATW